MPSLCPPDDQLFSLLSGRLEPASAEVLEQHVETCDRCQDTVRSLSVGSDSLLNPLREPSAASLEVEPGCERAIGRIRAMAGSDTVETIGYLQAELPKVAVEAELKTIREYQLLEKLGEGGMGAVYKAVHARLDKTVALKLLPRDRTRDQAAVARFQREMKAVGKLDHPHIVRAMDAGEVDGMHFLVMEYVQGMDLGLLARRLRKLPIADACELIRQAALGLAEAHEHGMVHRDIKPSNLILARPRRKQEQATVKVLDLGLALLAGESAFSDDGLTGTGQMMGTVDYMAPEQCRSSHDVDIRADIYSLGATLYRLLGGSSPLGSDRDNSILSKLVALATRPVQPLAELRPDVPPALATVVHTMLAKEPAERFATPEEVADALSPFCSGADLKSLLEQGEQAPDAADKQEKETLANRKSQLSDTATSHGQPQPVAARRRGRFPARMVGLALAAAGVLALVLGIVLYWETPEGTVRVEINDDKISAKFDKSGLVLTGADKEPISITAGEKVGGKNSVPSGDHTLTITRDGFSFKTKTFQLDRKKKTVLKIELIAGDVKVSVDDKELDRRSIQHNAASPARYALDFNYRTNPGRAHVVLPFLLPPLKACTVEMYVTPRSAADTYDNRQLFAGNGGLVLRQQRKQWSWGGPGKTSNGFRQVADDTSFAVGQRVHLAGVSTGTELRLYVNGRLIGATPLDGEPINSKDPCTLGGNINEAPEWPPFDGLIDEVRISKSARYKDAFAPEPRLEPDADTLALYHFDEGAGDVLTDSSENAHHARIAGARWVRFDGSAIEATSSKSPPAVAQAPFNAEKAKQHQQAWADYLGVPLEKEVELPGGAKMSFILIPPGEFLMGSTVEEQTRFLEEGKKAGDEKKFEFKWTLDHIASEGPQHRVRITRPYYLGKYEVTQAQWQAVMGNNPSHFKDNPTHPVESISRDDIPRFLTALNNAKSTSGMTFALPNQAQWEYACRAGTTTHWHHGDSALELQRYGWFKLNSGGTTHAVGALWPNPFGLYDMHGNVWECCADFYAADYYAKSPLEDPQGDSKGPRQVASGGAWAEPAVFCRSAMRTSVLPNLKFNDGGFRLALSIDDRPLGALIENANPPTPAIAPPSAGISALEFNGTSDYVELPAFPYKSTEPITIEAWFTAHSGDKGNPAAAEAKTDAVIAAFHIEPEVACLLVLDRPNSGWFSILQDSRFMSTCWYWFVRENKRTDLYGVRHHAAVVFEGKEVRLYVDGEPQRSGGEHLEGDAMPTGPSNVLPLLKNYFLGAAVSARDGKSLTRFFHGAMDEVRISQAARYKEKFVPDQHLSSDAQTLALYHFDEGAGSVLKDASGRGHDGKIEGAKWVKLRPPSLDDPTAQDFALDFNGATSHIHVPKLAWDARQPITLEAWAKLREAKAPADIVGVNGAIKLSAYRKLRALAYSGPNEYGWLDEADVTAVWRHVAATFDGERLRWFVDGKPASGKKYLFDGQSTWDQAELPALALSPAFADIPAGLWIGGERHGKRLANPLDGQLDEIRISRGVRYAAEFKPERRLAVDAETLALYHCNEGGGDTLWDSSSNQLDGKVVDVKWQEIETATLPLQIAEPPPLEEWLKGRTVLTVAQDGSGQFKTIQAALDVLKAGQVVKVLDKGPYRESLRMTQPPEDIGLISAEQTVVEIADWINYKIDTSKFEYRHGHYFLSARGLRLSGFHFTGTTDSSQQPHVACYMEGSSHVTIEDCRFEFLDRDKSRNPKVFAIRLNGSGPDANKRTVVRDCVIDGNLAIVAWPGVVAPPVLVLRNLVQPWKPGLGIGFSGRHRQVVARHNIVVTDAQNYGFVLALPKDVTPEVIDIADNTLVGLGHNHIQTSAPSGGVTIRNNVLSAFQLTLGAESDRSGVDKWTIRNNWYLIRPESLPEAHATVFRRPDDPVVEPQFLSENPADRNFARLAARADGLRAGALPLGQAPKEGDWFTRLRERWSSEGKSSVDLDALYRWHDLLVAKAPLGPILDSTEMTKPVTLTANRLAVDQRFVVRAKLERGDNNWSFRCGLRDREAKQAGLELRISKWPDDPVLLAQLLTIDERGLLKILADKRLDAAAKNQFYIDWRTIGGQTRVTINQQFVLSAPTPLKVDRAPYVQSAAARLNIITWQGRGALDDQDLPDRQAAEWAIALGGTVGAVDQQTYTKLDQLPTHFQIGFIGLSKCAEDINSGLPLLAKVETLGALSLSFTNLSDDGMKHIGGIRELNRLDIQNTPITGAGLKALANHPKLLTLWLNDTRVASDDLSVLATLPQLEQLSLPPEASDTAIPTLLKLKNLRALNTTGTKITAEGKAALQRKEAPPQD